MIPKLSLDLSKRFILLMGILVLFTAFSSQMFFGRQERANLETRLREKSSFINNFYSFLIADSLMRKDDVTLLQVINRLEEDQEIFSVIVADQRGAVRYHANSEKVGSPLEDAAMMESLKSGEATLNVYSNSGGKALALVTPLKIQGLARPAGVIRIDLTFRRIESQVTASRKRFWFIILGSLVTCAAAVSIFLNRWVLSPLQLTRSALKGINPALPDPHVPETPDEFGQVNAAINELLSRFKSELQQQGTRHEQRAEQEKAWIHQLVISLLPDARVIVADKDNRVLADSGNGPPADKDKRHLMDLIKDVNFATLLSDAFLKEGSVMRGPVKFQEKTYLASVLSVPLSQSVVVKTLIALQPN